MNNKKKSLNRKKGHRASMLSNMATSLIKEKRIFTTLSKAKVLRKYIEPIITKSKIDTFNSRRNVFSYLRNKTAVSELFKDKFENIRKRTGGYIRILKVGFRYGDQAPLAFVELVDFNNKKFYKNNIKHTRRSKKKKISINE